MNHVLVVNQMNNDLAAMTVDKFEDYDLDNVFSKLKNDDILLWLSNSSNVESQVFKLIDVIDDQNLKLKKMVMLVIAGVNGEIMIDQQEKLWGPDFENLILDSQYAIKMIDELEMPYIIVRIPIVVNEETAVEISNEGSQFKGNQIGLHQLADVVVEACLTDHYLNQSIGVSEG
ncbi:hypothetical protein FC70_GL001061 [Paucilactobacillus oligofermentans DSM 15707 = LMG 22743]|uniref:NAD(P)-binding domain-containing protein n=1 Tax=Paucilactobacillus oligofermentans DSM 15707 = LMG 22743 TaxID=1423778 RepID=A0A0R1RQE4_9LACO|nr:NAD(P)H-binding protein [Paucilactobacillus oligofermentans]KRL55464.1 hypothetical protein FC70_GL001061 [Paucilactobacillus oligofermentans DSM 15707 = LMG 22743]CUS25550.1 Uncharacterized protein LACOL_0242 [Paucilactobacillus oligofermentans DSM 15707 = LMG 22743]